MHAHSIAEDAPEIKAPRKKSTPQPDRWYKRYPDEYKRGTRKLSLAARGAYSDILDMIYMAGGPIEDDDFAIACELRVKQKVWLRARTELFKAGKLVTRDGWISNPKADEVLAEREARKAAQRSPNTPKSVTKNDGQKKLLQGKLSVINGGKATEAEAELEGDRQEGVCGEVENTITVAVAAGEPLPDWRVLEQKLFEAAGPAIDRSLGGFMHVGIPMWWLEQGCDLERDVLPTIRDVCARVRTDKLHSWKYFTKAVTAAKKQREQPLPTVDLLQVSGATRKSAKIEAAERAMAVANRRYGEMAL